MSTAPVEPLIRNDPPAWWASLVGVSQTAVVIDLGYLQCVQHPVAQPAIEQRFGVERVIGERRLVMDEDFGRNAGIAEWVRGVVMADAGDGVSVVPPGVEKYAGWSVRPTPIFCAGSRRSLLRAIRGSFRSNLRTAQRIWRGSGV